MPETKKKELSLYGVEQRRIRNRAAKTSLKTGIKKAEALISSGGKEAADAVKASQTALDRAAEKGTIHRNAAARRKSRLVKKLNKANAAPAEKKPAA